MDSAQAIIDALELKPLPVEGGFYRETHRTFESTAIYYLLTPSTASLLHRLKGDEVYHFYLGDPVELLELHDDGRSMLHMLGTQLAEDQRPQYVVRGGWWQGLRLRAGGRFALMGTTMAPPFDLKDFELGDRKSLLAKHASRTELILELTR